MLLFFFFNDTATTEIYTLSLHDALPILTADRIAMWVNNSTIGPRWHVPRHYVEQFHPKYNTEYTDFEEFTRSEEHTSELQSRQYLVCRLLLEKKKYESQVR